MLGEYVYDKQQKNMGGVSKFFVILAAILTLAVEIGLIVWLISYQIDA